MKRILFVVPSLEYGGAARQAVLVAKGLPRDRFLAEMCVLGSMGPWKGDLTKAGVATTSLGWNRRLDIRPVAHLRERIRGFRPDVIHVFKSFAFRAVAAARLGLSPRLVANTPWSLSTQKIPMRCLN